MMSDSTIILLVIFVGIGALGWFAITHTENHQSKKDKSSK